MKLELSFGSFRDLKEQLQVMIDELSVNDNVQLSLPVIEPVDVSGIREHVHGVSVITEVEVPKKRTRRTKEQIEAEKTKPVETAPVVEQPTSTLVPPVVEAEAPVTEPKNFYSASEFVSNFVIIINNLLNNGSIGVGDIEAACKYYDVKLIYMVGKDLSMCEHFYNDLVSRQIITKKGDY